MKAVDVHQLSPRLLQTVLHYGLFTEPNSARTYNQEVQKYPLIHLPAFFFPIKIFMFICQTRIAIEKCLSLNILEPFSEIREFCFPFKHSFLCCSDKGQNKRIKIPGPQWLNVTHGCFWSCSVTITYGRTNARHLHCGPAKPPALPVGSPTWTSILWSAFSMW